MFHWNNILTWWLPGCIQEAIKLWCLSGERMVVMIIYTSSKIVSIVTDTTHATSCENLKFEKVCEIFVLIANASSHEDMFSPDNA